MKRNPGTLKYLDSLRKKALRTGDEKDIRKVMKVRGSMHKHKIINLNKPTKTNKMRVISHVTRSFNFGTGLYSK